MIGTHVSNQSIISGSNTVLSSFIKCNLHSDCSYILNLFCGKLLLCITLRKQDIDTKREHVPLVDRTPLEPPPVVVAVVGPPKVGKSTLIQCLIKNFTKQPLTVIKGPVTLVSGNE